MKGQAGDLSQFLGPQLILPPKLQYQLLWLQNKISHSNSRASSSTSVGDFWDVAGLRPLVKTGETAVVTCMFFERMWFCRCAKFICKKNPQRQGCQIKGSRHLFLSLITVSQTFIHTFICAINNIPQAHEENIFAILHFGKI